MSKEYYQLIKLNRSKNMIIVLLVAAVISALCGHLILTNLVDEITADYEQLQDEHQLLLEEREIVKLAYYDYAAMIYDIEPELLEAIERHETGNYTSTLYKAHNNTWGAFNGEEYKHFDSHAQSTMELARCLKMYYFNEGLDTIEKIAEKYCPDDVANWTKDVTAIYEGLKRYEH